MTMHFEPSQVSILIFASAKTKLKLFAGTICYKTLIKMF